MPHSTSFHCPYCKRRLQLPDEIRPGTRTRCPHADCRRIFAYSPAEPGPVDEIPIDDSPPVDLMKELIEDEDRPPAGKTTPAARRGDGGLTSPTVPATPTAPPVPVPAAAGQPLPRSFRSKKTRQPVAGHPLAQASERSKEVLVGGRGVRFDEPRKYTGVFIGFVVAAAGYGAFVFFKYFFDQIHNAEKIRAAAIAKVVDDAEVKRKQKAEKAIREFQAKTAPQQKSLPRAGSTPTLPANTAALAVTLESARIGPYFPDNQQEFLIVTLRVANESKVENHTAAWPGPAVNVILRDAFLQQPRLVHKAFEDKKVSKGQPIQQVAVFERPPLGANLTLKVEIPEGLIKKNCTVEIPAAAIRKRADRP
ncbi:MAG: hypothetical protein ACLQIB_45295 [Isosphaeraceae bacterium]